MKITELHLFQICFPTVLNYDDGGKFWSVPQAWAHMCDGAKLHIRWPPLLAVMEGAGHTQQIQGGRHTRDQPRPPPAGKHLEIDRLD